MSDSAFDKYMQYGTNAQRLAFTPSPGGSQPIYIWYETDTGNTYLYDTTWHLIASSGGEASALVLIAETITAASATVVTFSSIPSTYRDLVLIVRGRSQESALTSFVNLKLNNDGTSIYDYEENYIITPTASNNTNTEGLAQAAITAPFIPGASASSSVPGSIRYEIFDYKGTTFHKDIIYDYSARWNTSTGTMVRGSGRGDYRSTSAINRVDVSLHSGSAFVNNSVVSLYGRH